MRFFYEGHDKGGRPREGEVEAENKESASAQLREQGLFVLSLSEEKGKSVLEHPDEDRMEIDVTKLPKSWIEAEVGRAVGIANEIGAALRQVDPGGRSEVMANACLSEMLAELAVRTFRSDVPDR
jgi:hypothetical protein